MEGALVPPALGWVVVFGVFYGKREAKKNCWWMAGTQHEGQGRRRKKETTERNGGKGGRACKEKKQRKAREEREASGEREMNNGVQKMHPK